jgi:hypothetical protein
MNNRTLLEPNRKSRLLNLLSTANQTLNPMKLKSYSLLAAVAGLLLAGSAQAYLVTNLINVQFRGSSSNPNGSYQQGQGTAYTGAAVYGDGSGSDKWNQEQVGYYYFAGGISISGASLVNSSNSASSLTYTLGYNNIIQGAQYGGTATDTATTNLMSGCFSLYNYSGNNTMTHTIGGLSGYAGATANLVVLAAAPSARTENIVITGGASGGNSGSTLSTSSTSRKISDGVGVAYQVFTNITLSGGNLVFTVTQPSPPAGDISFVNGFQLQIITTVTDPGIATQPASTTGFVNGPATLSVTPSGTAPFGYQWQATNAASANSFTNIANGGQFSGATTNTLTISSLTTNNALNYRVIVTNVNGAVTSSVASLSVVSSILLNADCGSGATMTGAAILGLSGDTWNVCNPGTLSTVKNSLNSTMSGVSVTVDTSGTAFNSGSATMDAGTANLMQDFVYRAPGGGAVPLAIGGLGTYTNYPITLVVYAGMDPGQPCTINITSGANGGNAGSTLNTTSATRKLSDGIGVAYNTFAGVTLTNATLNFAINGSSYHGPNGFQLQINDPYIIIASQPASITNVDGTTANFSVTASGAALTYQWQANGGAGFTNISGSKIAGATSSSLFITNATANDAISYQVIVSNSFSGSVTSSVALLRLSPIITAQPVAQATSVGSGASFSVTADGSPTLAYQWQANGGAGYTNLVDNGTISGSTASTLSITGATTNDAANYKVIVSNSYGSVTSSPAALVVGSSPVIAIQPISQTNNAGTTVSFTVSASGIAPLAYQWQADGGAGYTNISNVAPFTGANTNTLVITGIAQAQALSYQVIITNTLGSITSSPATLTVIDPPSITVQPASTSVVQGGTANFSVTATGTAPFTYQWQAGTGGTYTNLTTGGNVTGATTNALAITSVTTNRALDYRVILSNAAGSVTSTPAATLTVNVPAYITSQPSSAAVTLGSTATFSVVAAGDATLAYQWQASPVGAGTYTNIVNNGQLSGATSSTLTVTNVNNLVLNDYRVIVTNNYGAATSSVANLAILKLRINVDIGSTSAVQTNGAILGTTGDVWNGVTGSTSTIKNYTGATQSGLAYAVSGNFGFNSGGSTAMDSATTALMQDCAFGFVGQSASSFPVSLSGLSAYIGSSFTLVVYSGVGDPGQGASLTLAGGSGGNSHNTLLVSADTRQLSAGIGHAYQTFTGTITNGTLTITAAPNVNPTFFGINGFQLQVTATNVPDPVITSQPTSRTNVAGTTATFSVTATGSATLSYQWQADGGAGYTNLVDGVVATGSQSNVLTLTGVASIDAASYQVIVANADGSVTSSPAILTVTTLPVINTQPVSQTVVAGGTASFNVSATGASSYQWQANGGSGYTNLSGGVASGETTATLTLTGVSASDAISYQVIAINGSGSVTSTPAATLTVLPATTLVNAQFHSGPTGLNGPGYVYTGAGVLGNGGDVWSTYGLGYYVTPNVLFNAVPLTNAAGTANGMNVTVTQNGAANPVYGADYITGTAMDAATTNLMAGVLESFNFYSNPEVFVVSIGGLGYYTNSAFELVVYAAHNVLTQTLTLTSGATGGNTGSAVTTTATSRKLSDGVGVAYNVFTGTLTNGTLTFRVTSPTGANLSAALNGFQLLLSPTVAPIITVQPVSTAQSTGSNATFSVTAISSSTAGYQWQANGGAGYTNITGATSATLTRTAVTPADGVAYQVIVTNAGGAVTSSVANLTVISDVTAGSSFTLGVVLGSSQTVQIVGGKHAPSNLTGSTITVTGVTGSTNGTVSTDGTNVTYTATNGTADSFTYTVTDTYGGTATQTISVAISTNVQGFNLISAQIILGDAVLTYAGIPGNNYALDETHSLSQPITWTPVTTNAAATNGFLIFTNTPSGTNDFYRTRYVP